MSAPLKITRLIDTTPPVYIAEMDGKSFTIRLDSSAILKLEGDAPFTDNPEAWFAKAPVIRRAAERLISECPDMNGHGAIILSALDLDPR